MRKQRREEPKHIIPKQIDNGMTQEVKALRDEVFKLRQELYESRNEILGLREDADEILKLLIQDGTEETVDNR